jgi:hypothetical protein
LGQKTIMFAPNCISPIPSLNLNNLNFGFIMLKKYCLLGLLFLCSCGGDGGYYSGNYSENYDDGWYDDGHDHHHDHDHDHDHHDDDHDRGDHGGDGSHGGSGRH